MCLSSRSGGFSAHGVARIAFAGKGSDTRLCRLYQRQPLRVLLPRPAPGDLLQAVILNTGGGLVGGDELEIDIRAGEAARVQVTTQAAEKAYRSAGPEVSLATLLTVGRDAWLEWLPQETILFDGLRLRRRIRHDVAPGGRALAGEIVVFGRQAHGEDLRTGLFRDDWSVRIGDRLTFKDVFRLEGELAPVLAAPFALAGARAMAMLLYVADDAEGWLEPARELLEGGGSARRGLTSLPGLLIGRWLGPDAAACAALLARLSAVSATPLPACRPARPPAGRPDVTRPAPRCAAQEARSCLTRWPAVDFRCRHSTSESAKTSLGAGWHGKCSTSPQVLDATLRR
jgi:urease accessory protein